MERHEITIDPQRDSDNLVVWHCSCGQFGTDYDQNEADESIEMHLNDEQTLTGEEIS